METKEELHELVTEWSNRDPKKAADAVVDALAKKLVTRVLNMIFIPLLFIGLMFAVKVIAGVIDRAVRLPVLGSANTFLGGFLGLMKGAAVVIVVVFALGIAVKIFGSSVSFLSRDTINNTYIFKYIDQINPLI